MLLWAALATVLLSSVLGEGAGNTSSVYPVILVPGDGGSQIEARLNKTEVAHFWCSKTSDWYDLWLNIEQMLTVLVSCWVDNVRLVYDNATRTTSNAPGVEIRIPGFGNTSSVEYIDKSEHGFSTYFAMIVTGLLPQGYTRGSNLHGAPYDFRRAANEHGEYFVKVKSLVEETYAANENTPVVLVCHSMGSIMMHYFLQQQSQAWKDQHIRALVTISGVWGGTARALKVFSLGDNLDSWFLNSKNLLWERTNPSLAWLMPQKGFWSDDEVLVETEQRNFTRTDLADFFISYREPNMASMVEDTRGLLGGLPPPQVEVFCTHGTQVDTTERLVYPAGTFPPSEEVLEMERNNSLGVVKKYWPWPSGPSLVKGDGDGTVNIRSLKGCLRWSDKQKQPVTHKEFPGINHVDMLRKDEPTAHVVSILAELNKELQRKRTAEDKEENMVKETEGRMRAEHYSFEHDSDHGSPPIIEIIKSGK